MSKWVNITTVQGSIKGKRRFLKARDLKQQTVTVDCPDTLRYGPTDYRGLLYCWACPSADCPKSQFFAS